jgi:pyruvate/2-oxoglutarate dehydrogenase complex dihydrolipoamide dehydrogenase (E3) component
MWSACLRWRPRRSNKVAWRSRRCSLEFPTRDWGTVATGIYTIPEACACGPTEAELSAAGVPYLVGRSLFRHNARGQIIGDTDGFVKLLFHRETRRLLATHLICERATELIHIGQAVMRLGGGIDLSRR